jgi:glucose/arabinose dehydrogenase
LEVFATGIRNGNGLAIGPGDVVTLSPQEGNWTPASAIFEVHQGGFYGMMPSHHRETAPRPSIPRSAGFPDQLTIRPVAKPGQQ